MILYDFPRSRAPIRFLTIVRLVEQELCVEPTVRIEDPRVQVGTYCRGTKRPRTVQGRTVHGFHRDNDGGLYDPQPPREDIYSPLPRCDMN